MTALRPIIEKTGGRRRNDENKGTEQEGREKTDPPALTATSFSEKILACNFLSSTAFYTSFILIGDSFFQPCTSVYWFINAGTLGRVESLIVLWKSSSFFIPSCFKAGALRVRRVPCVRRPARLAAWWLPWVSLWNSWLGFFFYWAYLAFTEEIRQEIKVTRKHKSCISVFCIWIFQAYKCQVNITMLRPLLLDECGSSHEKMWSVQALNDMDQTHNHPATSGWRSWRFSSASPNLSLQNNMQAT